MSESRYAVLIGNSTYPQDRALSDLRCPGRDVDGLERALKSPQVGFNEVRVLKDIPHHLALKEVNQVLKKAKKTDLVLIYFSGHGKLDPANRLHLCSVDTEIATLEATAIPVQSIKNFIDIAETRKVGLILDCCFSGAVGGVFAKGGVDDQLQQMSGGRGVYVIAASTAIQAAVEKEGDEYSVFTKHFIEGLEKGSADSDTDGRVTLDELYEYVHDKVLDEGSQQPMKWTVNVEGDMVVANASLSRGARAKVRQRLLELAGEGVLPDRVLSEALKHLEAPAEGNRELDKLLNDLANQTLTVGEFVGEWHTRRKRTQEIHVGAPKVDPNAEVARKDTERRERERLEEQRREVERQHAQVREELLKAQALKEEVARRDAVSQAAREDAARKELARLEALRAREQRGRALGSRTGSRLPGEGNPTPFLRRKSVWVGGAGIVGIGALGVILWPPDGMTDPYEPFPYSTESPYTIDFESGTPSTFVGDWSIATDQAVGIQSIASARIGDNQTSTFSLNPPAGVGSVTFDFRTDSEIDWDYLTVLINGVEQGPALTSQGVWTTHVLRFAPLAPMSALTWRYSKDGSTSEGADRVWVDNIVFGSGLESFESGLLPGDFVGDWRITSSYASGGTGYSVESATIGDSGSSYFELRAPVGAVGVAFDFRTDVEEGFDYLFLISDGIVQGSGLNSAGGWIRQTVNFGSGSQVVRWEYRKDDSQSAGMDRVWVDNIEFLFSVPGITP